MRVLMVQTPSVEGITQERVYPLGVVTLASRIKAAGHEVAILDMNLETDPYGKLKEKLLSYQPQAVGFSLRNIDPLANKTSSLIPPFVVTVRLVSTILPKAWLIVGGTGFSLFPDRLMRELPQLHYGIVGEGEFAFPELLASLEDPGEIKGLCRREGQKIRINQPSREYDMAHYTVPERYLQPPELYKGINNYVPTIGIETKRGCPFTCAYCVYPKLQGRKIRCRPPVAVVDELEALNKEFGITSFHFTDPVVNMPNGHMEEICREILRRRLKIGWNGFLREDNLNPENVKLFAESGCECFSFSPDGFCQEALDVLQKGLKEEDIFRAASLVSQTDVLSVYHFMVNVPGETEETLEKGINMMEHLYELHSKKKNLGAIVLNNIRIFPGTPIEAIAREKGVIGQHTDLLYPTYYNPSPFDQFRYKLETLNLSKNVLMWQEVR